MFVQRSYLPISIIIVLLAFFLYRFAVAKPRFVVPETIWTILYRIGSLIAILCLALLPLQIQRPIGYSSKPVVPVQILFDVSLSMTADDITPSRFAVGKDIVDELLLTRDGYPVSIILFSGIPFVHVPFSTYTQAIGTKRSQTQLGQFPPVGEFLGTAIGDALLLALNNLYRNNYGDGIILLMTDGDSNRGFEPADVLSILENHQIPVFAIGVGDPNPFVIGYDYFGGEVSTSYDPLFLQVIPEATGGDTWLIENITQKESIIAAVGQVIQERQIYDTMTDYFLLNRLLLWIILLWIGIMTSIRIWVWINKK